MSESLLLYKIVLKGFPEESKKLYVRGGAEKFEGILAKGEYITLDTYFNSFSCAKFLQYTTIRDVEINIEVQGRVLIELFLQRKRGREKKIYQIEKDWDAGCVMTIPFHLSEIQGACFAFLKITALSETAAIIDGNYTTRQTPEHPVHLAVLICTFRREKYLERTIERICRELLEQKWENGSKSLNIYITDNGGTVFGPAYEDKRIHLLHSPNCGGSGGFTRSLIEALREPRHTHVLFMDDDIYLDTNVISKITSVLQYVKPEKAHVAIAGGMLNVESPTVQHEAGALWKGDGRLHSLGHGIDLSERKSLFQNEAEQRADYGGWWCFAMNIVDTGFDNLPLPLFLKCDDIEYSLRNVKDILVMNGIGVWHEPFEKKLNTLMDYYSIRNELILNAIYSKAGMLKILWILFRPMLRAVAEGSMSTIRYVELAVEDYLRGVAFFYRTDMAEYHQWLRGLGSEAVEDRNTFARMIMLCKKCFSKDLGYCLSHYGKLCGKYLSGYQKAKHSFEHDWKGLGTLAFWAVPLGMVMGDGDLQERVK